MLFKGNSSRLELLIGKIQAHKDRSQIISSGLNKALTGCTLLFLWTDIVSLRRPTLDVGKK